MQSIAAGIFPADESAEKLDANSNGGTLEQELAESRADWGVPSSEGKNK